MKAFLDTLSHGYRLFRAEVASLSFAVVAWMWAMRIAFGSNLIFLPRWNAFATLLAMVVTGISGFIVRGLYPEMPAIQIGALSHIVLWPAVLLLLLFRISIQRKPGSSTYFEKAFAGWQMAVVIILTISFALMRVQYIVGQRRADRQGCCKNLGALQEQVDVAARSGAP